MQVLKSKEKVPPDPMRYIYVSNPRAKIRIEVRLFKPNSLDKTTVVAGSESYMVVVRENIFFADKRDAHNLYSVNPSRPTS